jgi:hypothetical protein
MNPWDVRAFSDGEMAQIIVGELRLSVGRRGDEWHLGREYLNAQEVADAAERESTWVPLESWPESALSGRWITLAGPEDLPMTPVVPDLPVVVRPESPMHLPPGRKLTFFLTVPSWTRITAHGKQSILLAEFPTVVLSKTWFGDPMAGELCYSLTTLARRQLQDVPPLHHLLTCPVEARNASDEQLLFERFCARLPNLSTYLGQSRLWTNQLRVTFRGMEAGSTVECLKDPPRVEAILNRLSSERETQARGQRLRSFTTFNALGDLFKMQGGI